MFDILPKALRDFVDTIFNPPIEILNNAVTYLDRISMIAGKGINLNNYLSFMNYLPASFQMVVNSLLASVIFLAILQIVRAIVSLYFSIKEGVKWW
jgi:hypothetical protein